MRLSSGLCLVLLAVGCGNAPISSSTSSLNYAWQEVARPSTTAGHALAYLGGNVYAVNVQARSVLAIDGATRQLATTIGVGRGPAKFATDGKQLYVINQWAQDDGDPYVSAIDPATNRVVRSLYVSEKIQGNDPNNYPWTSFPQGVTVVGNDLVVTFPTNPIPDAVTVDLATFKEKGQLWAAGSGPWDLTSAAGLLVVLNERAIGNPNDDAVRIARPDGTLVTTLETGGALRRSVSAGGRAFITRSLPNGEGDVLVVDPVTQATRSIKVGEFPSGMTAIDDRIYVVCTDANRIDIIDVASEAVVDHIDLSTFSEIKRPRDVAVTPSGDIYVGSDDLVSVLMRP